MPVIAFEDYRERIGLARKRLFRKILQDVSFENCSVKVVEMGVGRGEFSLALKEFFPAVDITVVDKNLTYFIDNLEEKKFSPVFKMLKKDITHTSISLESIDWVFCYNLMHHFVPEEVILSLEEAYRIIKNQGKVVIIDTDPKPQNEAQQTLLKIYETEARIDLELGNAGEKMYTLIGIVNLLYKTGFIIMKEKEYFTNSVSLPYSVWDELKERIEKSCKQLNKEKKHIYIKELEGIEKEVNSHGLETLPSFMIFARKSKINEHTIPFKIDSVKSRLEENAFVLLYHKNKGILVLNKTGALMWNLCNGEKSVEEIAKKVVDITIGGNYRKALMDTRGFFLSLFQKGFVDLKRSG